MRKIISTRGRAKLLQPAGPVSTLTRVQMIELNKCAIDPVYFMNTYLKTAHPLKGPFQITLHQHQNEYVQEILRAKNVIAMMPRQVGMTSTSLAYVLWETLFKRNHRSIVLAHNQHHAQDLSTIFHFMFDNLPEFMKLAQTSSTKKQVAFDNGSSVIFGPMTSTALRGMTYNRLYLDGFAYASPAVQHDLWLSVIPAISGFGSRVLIASQPHGKGNTFATLWADSGRAMATFTQFKRTADQIPSIAPHRQQIEAMVGPAAWLEQFMCEFV